jgi:hypothetical protein
MAAEEAVSLAYSTQQVSERAGAEMVRDSLPSMGDVELADASTVETWTA